MYKRSDKEAKLVLMTTSKHYSSMTCTKAKDICFVGLFRVNKV